MKTHELFEQEDPPIYILANVFDRGGEQTARFKIPFSVIEKAWGWTGDEFELEDWIDSLNLGINIEQVLRPMDEDTSTLLHNLKRSGMAYGLEEEIIWGAGINQRKAKAAFADAMSSIRGGDDDEGWD